MNITKQLSRFNHYEGGNSKDYIIIHSTGNTNDTAKNNADYFGRADRGASAHYFVDDNSIYQVVEDNNCSWSCGDGHNKYGIGNRNTIAIEMCGTDDGNISDKTIENTLELTKSLMCKYGIDIEHVVRHYDASRKCCPSQFSPNDWERWSNFKSRLEGKKVDVGNSNNESVITTGTVTASALNVRSGAGTSRSKIGLLGNGSKVEIIGKNGVWYKIKYNGGVGYVHSSYVDEKKESKPTHSNSNDEIKRYTEHGTCTIVTSSGLNIRTAPSTSSSKVGMYNKGERVVYDLVVITSKYVWISWVGASSGKRRYMAIKDRVSGERWGNCV